MSISLVDFFRFFIGGFVFSFYLLTMRFRKGRVSKGLELYSYWYGDVWFIVVV